MKMKRSKKGFRRASTFIQQLTKESLEKRGFAQSKLITNWNEIVGSELFKISRPIKMSFPKNGLGATLTIEIDGAVGPEIDMQRHIIQQKINRVYGYRAITKIKFKVSAEIGYDIIRKDNLLFDQNDYNFEKNKIVRNDMARQDLTFKLEKTKNQKLRQTLQNICSSFLNSSKH